MSGLSLAILILLTVLVILVGLYFLRNFFSDDTLPYVARENLNTPAEGHFFRALQKAVRGRYMIAPKVRVADVLDVAFVKRKSEDKRWWHYFRQISSKHVDFVLCEHGGGHIIAAIELDDRSHLAKERQIRDEFLEKAFASARVPLIRVPVQTHYDVDALRGLIESRTGKRDEKDSGHHTHEDTQG